MPNDSTQSAGELRAGLLQLAHRLQDVRGVAHDEKLAEAVETMARLAGAEHSILRMLDSRGNAIATYTWAKHGPAKDSLEQAPASEIRERFAWSTRRYIAGETTMVEELSELPPEAEGERSFLEGRGVRSWLAIPFRSRGVAIGYQSFDTFHYAKRWSDDEISALQLMAEILASTIMRVQAEQAGRESEERFFRVFNEHPDAMVVVRLEDDAIAECNPAWLQLAGVASPSEAIGRSIFDFTRGFSPREIREFGRKLAEEGETEETEFRMAGLDGSERIVHASTGLIEFSGDACALTTVRDVTERHHLREQLQQAQKNGGRGPSRRGDRPRFQQHVDRDPGT